MAYCEQCGAELREGDVFCSKCGARVMAVSNAKKICSHCQSELKEDDLFCPVCGYRVESSVLPIVDDPKPIPKPIPEPQPQPVPDVSNKTKVVIKTHAAVLVFFALFASAVAFFILTEDSNNYMTIEEELYLAGGLGMLGYLFGVVCIWGARVDEKKAAKETNPARKSFREKNVNIDITGAYLFTVLVPIITAFIISFG